MAILGNLVGVMQIKSAEFVTSAERLEQCPQWATPEFAFIGRSNVGKSSLVNLLAGRHALAKVSATPGKTRQLNFFLINQRWSLVDLPGYGYAKASRSDKAAFNQLVAGYLSARPNLSKVYVLIDSRHEPQAIDLEFVEWLSATTAAYELVFTKVDKLPAGKVATHARLFIEALAGLGLEAPPVIPCSAKTKVGRQELLGSIREGMDA